MNVGLLFVARSDCIERETRHVSFDVEMFELLWSDDEQLLDDESCKDNDDSFGG